MRTRKGVLLTLAVALGISLCGAGGLKVCMAKTMQSEVATQVEQKEDIILEEGAQEVIANPVNQVWQEEKSIYLPEGAQIVSEAKNSYRIVWDNYTIEYWQGDKYLEKETQEDLGLGKLLPILQDTIKKYSGQDMSNCEIEVSLVGTEGDFEGGEACEPIVELETTDGKVCILGGEPAEDATVREYEMDSKHYQVWVLFDKHQYFIMVDSVTGEVFGYSYLNQNLGDYSNGWEKVMSYDPVEYELSEEEQKEYDAMIASFVTNDLNLGNVEKVFAQDWGLAYLNNGSIDDARAYYSALCKTDNGTMVEVSVDMGEKMVICFDTTIIYSSEG